MDRKPQRARAGSGWREFLQGLGAERIEPGASVQEIAHAEKRLGVTLPPGYRAFLLTSNGFGPVGNLITRLRPVKELRWLLDEDPELIQIWAEATSQDADEMPLAKTLVVSDEYDGGCVLLNPSVRAHDGEWEAWFFAHWVPGEEVFPSFRALLEETFARFLQAEKAARGEPTPHVAGSLGVDAEDLEGLVAALRRTTVNERVNALDGLANLRNTAAVPPVVEVLKSSTEDAYVRQTAARTLGQLRAEESVSALIDVLRMPYPQGRMFDAERRSDEQEEAIGLKHAAKQGLLYLGELARPALASALQDPDPELRAEACATLCHAHEWSTDALELVAPLIADPHPDVRLTLVTHIDQLSHDRGRELLHRALDDADPRVSEAARRTLDRLESYGP